MSGLPGLRSVELILTAGCNLRCAYCYQNRKTGRRMPWPVARAAVDLLLGSRRRGLTLALTGGEPLLEFDLFRRVVGYAEAARPPAARLRLVTSTNGLLLDQAKAAFLAAHRVRTHLSFDGVPASQDLRGPGTFPVLDRLLDRLRLAHPAFFRKRLEVSVTLTSASVPHLAESVRYFLRKGVRKITVFPAVTHDPGWRRGDLAALDREFGRVTRTCLRHYRDTGEVPLTCLRGGPDREGRRPGRSRICSAGTGRGLAVDVDGQVHGCVLFAASCQTFPPGLLRDRLGRSRLGDVRDPGLGGRLVEHGRALEAAGIFDHREAKHSSYGRCGACRHYNSCNICPMSIGHAPGNTDPDRIPDLPCAWNLVTGKYRRRFPVLPRAFALATGAIPLPKGIRALLALAPPG